MNTAILILAATNFRIDYEPCRHLLDINGEPLLLRTLRQLEELGYDATVITEKPEVWEVIPDHCYKPANHRWIVSTMLSTRELWREKTIILMGDVVWDLYVLGLILGFQKLPAFFGNYPGIHAIGMAEEHFDKFETALKKVERHFNPKGAGGRCWPIHLYRVFCDKGINDNQRKWPSWPYWFTIRTMKTAHKSCVTDFDTFRRYEEWQKIYGDSV